MKQIGLNDLHPAIGSTIQARAWSMRAGHLVRPEDAEAHRVLSRRWKGIGWRILAAVPIGAILGVAVGTAMGGNEGQVIGVAFMTAYFSGLGTGVGSVVHARLGRRQSISAEELRALSSGMEFGKPEQAYLETVCGLLEAWENVSEQTGRDILDTLNELLEHSRYLDDRLARLRSAASSESVQVLEAERERIAIRAADAQDAQARDDLSQSLSICDERLRNARELQPLIERLDAQREVIVQTLYTVQSSVSRLQVAPAALSAPDVADVKRVVTEVTTKTKAVEDAVEQVMALQLTTGP